jgi:hypothetical protein
MDPSGNPRTEIDAQDPVDRGPRAEGLRSINRRDWLQLTLGGGAGPGDWRPPRSVHGEGRHTKVKARKRQ